MKRILKNKKIITVLAVIIILLCLTGCNKQIVDVSYSYDTAICNISGEYKELEIKKWKDYDGEQLQIVDKKGNVYLVSSVNCTLVNEK